VVPAAFGINLRFAFGLGDTKAKTRQEEWAEMLPLFKSVRDTTIIIRKDTIIYAPTAQAVYSTAPAPVSYAPASAARHAVAPERVVVSKEDKEYAAALDLLQEPISDFAVSQIDITSEQATVMRGKIDVMKRYDHLKIIIEGHTCDLGTHESNIIVGQERADAAKLYMVERSIAPNRIRTVSEAETKPFVPNTGDTNRRKNRRVEFKVIE
jgi:outer membrane protein OmpA-like peptidoglycan-associated protein